LNGVLLDGRALGGWTACLTRNFIPDYQKKLGSNQLLSNNPAENKPFVDIFAKYERYDNLLTSEKLK
jgi:hypothetical protein